jgi:hypothetical protein
MAAGEVTYRKCPVCRRRVRRWHHRAMLLGPGITAPEGLLADLGLVRARVVVAHKRCLEFTELDADRILGPVP